MGEWIDSYMKEEHGVEDPYNDKRLDHTREDGAGKGMHAGYASFDWNKYRSADIWDKLDKDNEALAAFGWVKPKDALPSISEDVRVLTITGDVYEATHKGHGRFSYDSKDIVTHWMSEQQWQQINGDSND